MILIASSSRERLPLSGHRAVMAVEMPSKCDLSRLPPPFNIFTQCTRIVSSQTGTHAEGRTAGLQLAWHVYLIRHIFHTL